MRLFCPHVVGLGAAADRPVLSRLVPDIRVPPDACRPAIENLDRVLDLAGRVPARFRALILLAAFTSLRYGELAALRRADLGTDLATVTVRATLVQFTDGRVMFGPPKSVAGRRTVSVPEAIRDDLRSHLRNYVGDAPMIYQHATKQRDTTIADALSATTAAARDRARNGHELSQEIN